MILSLTMPMLGLRVSFRKIKGKEMDYSFNLEIKNKIFLFVLFKLNSTSKYNLGVIYPENKKLHIKTFISTPKFFHQTPPPKATSIFFFYLTSNIVRYRFDFQPLSFLISKNWKLLLMYVV